MRFAAIQCTWPGLALNRASNPTAYQMSGRVAIIAYISEFEWLRLHLEPSIRVIFRTVIFLERRTVDCLYRNWPVILESVLLT